MDFTFGFGGVLSATAACTFLLWCNQKRGHIPLIDTLPETNLVFDRQLTPVLKIIVAIHTRRHLWRSSGIVL